MAAAPDSPARTPPPSAPEAPTAAQQQPESIADLPLAWLRRLVTSSHLSSPSWAALVRTCTAMRDLVLESRRLTSWVVLPVPAHRFQNVLDGLCVAAGRSRNVVLLFRGSGSTPWSSAAHLLQSATAQLGGPLAPVVQVGFFSMQFDCALPSWLAAACPNVRSVTLDDCTIAGGGEHGGEDVEGSEEADGEEEDTEEEAVEQHQQEEQDPAPQAFRRLQGLGLGDCWVPPASPGGVRLRRQLRALTTLRSLDVGNMWDFERPSLVSSSVTDLAYQCRGSPRLTSLPVQFPAVRQLGLRRLTLDDGGLDAVLSLASLRALRVAGFALRRSHAQQRCALETLTFTQVDVDSFSRLPWSGIQACRGVGDAMSIHCSSSTQTTAAVVAALQQRAWDAAGADWLYVLDCHSGAVLEATLPLMALMRPKAQLIVRGLRATTPAALQQLGHFAAVSTLALGQCSLTEDAWPALLPALPHTSSVYLFDLAPPPTEQQLVALCQGATRPVRVELSGGPPSDDDADALCQRVMQAAGNGRATLTWRAY